jgi:hypothetical protein
VLAATRRARGAEDGAAAWVNTDGCIDRAS